MICTDRDQLTSQLAMLQQAKMELVLGNKPVTVTYNGMTTTFTPTSLAQINATIAEIQSQLGIGGRRAIAVGFGCR